MLDLHFFIERLDATSLSGWCFDPADPIERIQVELWAGGQMLGSGLADIMRADLAQVGYGDGACGFKIARAAAEIGRAVEVVLTN